MASSTPRRMSWRIAAPLAAIAALTLASCSSGQESTDTPGTTPPVWTGSNSPAPTAGIPTPESEKSSTSVTGEFKDPSGKEVGTVTFTKVGDALQVKVEAEGLTPGFHGLHVHSVGKCEANSVAPTGGETGNFLSAGGHFQKEGHTGHPASGDLTSLQALEHGATELVTMTDGFTMEDLTPGRAVIIHANADNFANIPNRYTLADGAAVPDQTTLSTGDAGGRVACAVVK